ncbi:MAG: hypothetical protein MK077_08745 [Phycisphaerales bacterium]|nr:hypothetical protein [Phycisphaerales bacterium]
MALDRTYCWRRSLGVWIGAAVLGAASAVAQPVPPQGNGDPQAQPDRGPRGERGAQPDRGPRGERGAQPDRGPRGERGARQGERGRRGGERAGRPGRGEGQGDRQGRGGGRPGGSWGSMSDGVLGGPMGRVSSTLFKPDYLTRDSLMIIEALQLDDRQSEVVEMLLDDYDANFRVAVEETQFALRDMSEASGVAEAEEDRMSEVRERMEAMRSEMREMRAAAQQNGDDENAEPRDEAEVQEAREAMRERMREMRDDWRAVRDEQMESEEMQTLLDEQIAVLKTFANARRSMRREMGGALEAILAEEQLKNWDVVDRWIRRIRLLPEGRLQGESTDLRPIADATAVELDPVRAAALEDILLAWELDVDDALLKRRNYDETAIWKMFESMKSQDYEALMRVLKQRQNLAERIRDVNDVAIEEAAESMGEADGAAFRLEALRRGYGRVFQTSRSERAIESALQLEDLEEQLIADIKALQGRAVVIMADENESVLKAVRQNDEAREIQFVQRAIDRQNGEETQWGWGRGEDDPIRIAYDARDEQDRELIEELRALLGDELAAEVRGMNERQRGQDRAGMDWNRSGDREAMRRQFMERFDSNGDGEISEEERSAIRTYFQQQRGGGGGGPGGGPPPRPGS